MAWYYYILIGLAMFFVAFLVYVLTPSPSSAALRSRKHEVRLQIRGWLRDGDLSGREIRARLGELGLKVSRPEFYMFMARMEDDGLVHGYDYPKQVRDLVVRERRYRWAAGTPQDA